MRILLLDTKPVTPNFYLVTALFQALSRHPHVEHVALVHYHDALPTALAGRYDAFLAFDGEEANNPIVARLAQLIPVRLIWFTEDPYELSVNKKTASNFDAVFTTDEASVTEYPMPAYYLPLAASRTMSSYDSKQTLKRYDLFFAGTAWPNRLILLKALRDRVPALKAKFVLVTNSSLEPFIDQYRNDFRFAPGISIADFCRFSQNSVATLTLGREFSTSVTLRTKSSSPGPRLFEAAAAGACQLVDMRSIPLASNFYQAHKEFVPFDNLTQLAERLPALIADHEAAARIGAAARQRTLTDHLYENRAEVILRCASELLNSKNRRNSSNAVGIRPPHKTKILFVAHNMTFQGGFGGAEVYLDALLAHLTAVDVNILTADQSATPGSRFLLLDRSGIPLDSIALAPPYSSEQLTDARLEAYFAKLLAENAYDIVHFNHLLPFPPSLLILAKTLGTRVVYTLHDYFAICDDFNLIGPEGTYCQIPNRPEAVCDICRQRSAGLLPGSMARRRRFFREAFRSVELVIAGSHASAQIFCAMFPSLAARTVVQAPPIGLQDRTPAAPEPTSLLHVAILGNFTYRKGAAFLLQIFELSRALAVHFHVFGRIDASLRDELTSFEGINVTAYGPFPPNEPPASFRHCTVGLFLSDWPETYCLTLSEALCSGIVPIVSRVGALPERVIDGKNGFVVEVGDVGLVVERLRQCSADAQLVARLRKECLLTAVTDAGTYVGWLQEQYSALLADGVHFSPTSIVRHLTLEELGVHLEQQNWTAHATTVATSPVEQQNWTAHSTTAAASRGSFYTTRELVALFVAVARSRGLRAALLATARRFYLAFERFFAVGYQPGDNPDTLLWRTRSASQPMSVPPWIAAFRLARSFFPASSDGLHKVVSLVRHRLFTAWTKRRPP